MAANATFLVREAASGEVVDEDGTDFSGAVGEAKISWYLMIHDLFFLLDLLCYAVTGFYSEEELGESVQMEISYYPTRGNWSILYLFLIFSINSTCKQTK